MSLYQVCVLAFLVRVINIKKIVRILSALSIPWAVYILIFGTPLAIMALFYAIGTKKIEIDKGQISFTFPFLLGFSIKHRLSDFDGLCTLDSEDDDRKYYRVGLVKNHRVRTTIYIEESDNVEKVVQALGEYLPDRGRYTIHSSTADAVRFGVNFFLPRIEY